MFPTTLITVRLHLRPLVVDDAQAVFERWASDPTTTRFVSWKTYQQVDEARRFIERVTSKEQNPNETVWAICLGDDPTPSGTIGAIRRKTRVEIGFLLRRSIWKQGYATEAAKAVIGASWSLRNICRVEAHCHPENKASARVLEKCGMIQEGYRRSYLTMPQLGEKPQDCLAYAIVSDDL